MGKLKAQYLFDRYKKANKPYRKETYEQDKKAYDRATFEFAHYMFLLAVQNKLFVKVGDEFKPVNIKGE